jgi:hypothetical protein
MTPALRAINGFELFSRQTPGMADGPAEAFEQGVSAKPGEVAVIEAIAGGSVHGTLLRLLEPVGEGGEGGVG